MSRACLLWCACLAMLAGCSGAPDDAPEVGQVKGTVKRAATPVIKARVYFAPVDGGRSSEAETDGQGQYELVYLRDIKGAKIGEHRVTITTFEDSTLQDDGKRTGGRPEEIPTKWSGGEERVTVKAGEQVIDFDVSK